MSSPRLRCLTFGLGAIALAACHGDVSHEPPVHVVLNMDHQQKYEAQEANPFFADKRAMRLPVPGTVAVGQLKDDDHLHRGIGEDGELADSLPSGMKLDTGLLERGRDRYAIFCVPCHDPKGLGKGPVVTKGFMPPPSLLDDRLRQSPLGHLYKVIAEGLRNMPSYASQIPVEDRWAIAAYVRALQVSQSATLSQVPKDVASGKGWAQK